MENKSQWVGIDVSKATLDVYLRPMGKAIKIDNNEEGITDLVNQLKAVEINLIVLEATGGLETEVIIQLQTALLPVAMINPRQGRDFALINGTAG
jgi:transposase